MRSDPQVNQYVDRPKPKDLADVHAYIDKILAGIAAQKMFNWSIYPKDSQQYIGSLGYWQFNEAMTKAEIGYELHPSFWGQGIMREVYEATLPFVRDELKLQEVEAWVHPENVPSIKFLTHQNYEKVRLVPAGEAGDAQEMLVMRYYPQKK